jgi:hypothetical protein
MRVPWLIVGLIIGFGASAFVTPDYYLRRVWQHEPWRYYAIFWGPVIGVCGVMLIEMLISTVRRLKRRRSSQPCQSPESRMAD